MKRPDVAVKICGLTRPGDVTAAAEAGAVYAGFVFFPRSPRNVDIATARSLALQAPPGLAKVGLLVDADDAQIAAILDEVPLDMLQLHGREDPARVVQVKARFGLPVMKAVGIAGAEDLPRLDEYAAVADQLLVETKAPKEADRPGGNGRPFDWGLIAGRRWRCPWMLAGGLTAENVGEAVTTTRARQVDVSSGVESSPGHKDAALFGPFVLAAQADPVPQL